MPRSVAPYDALLVVSFGGPERPEDVMPFLENVTRGRGIPAERLAEVGGHYFDRGGKSPINDLNRAFVAAVQEDLSSNGIDIPVFWGNRNWEPYLVDAVRRMQQDGVKRAACLVTSAYASYSGCRQYRENLYDAAAQVTAELGAAPRLDRLRHYFNHPGFLEPMVDSTLAALADLKESTRNDARLLFVTHSLPESLSRSSGPPNPIGLGYGSGGAYVAQHLAVAEEIAERVRQETGHRYPHELVYCSRSGDPRTPWLGPDISARISELAGTGLPGVVVVPIGFVADHMEVVYDLDTEAAETARSLGLDYARAATAGLDPRFVGMVRELLVERAAVTTGGEPTRPVVGSLPPSWDVCPRACCGNLNGARPALAGLD